MTNPMNANPMQELDRRLERMRHTVSRLEGRREQLNERESELKRSVGLAKGRLALKGEVDKFLDELQADANARTIGNYSKLLTALTQDVLPNNVTIGLDITTERGLPALDIFAQQGERKLNILRSCGGSLTNVVSLGLRSIATVKSGLRPFLALDEQDCWIAPHRVPAYYRVVKQMATRMNFQALVISHHDVNLFDSGINVIEVRGTPEAGVEVRTRAGAEQWKDDSVQGIRAIVMRNFASYADVRINLSPGLNAIIGDNNIGKSRIMQMFRAVAYGGAETSDADIRDGERRAEVEIHLEHGRVLHWSRELRRNPVNMWHLHDKDGEIVTVDGMRCESGGKNVPEWVSKVLGINQVDGLDIQLGTQSEPVFLLGKPATQRAAVLSMGRESNHLRRMITTHRENCARDKTTVKTGEAEMAKVTAQIEALKDLDDIKELIEKAIEIRDQYADTDALIKSATEMGMRLSTIQKGIAKAKAQADVLKELPEFPNLKESIEEARAANRMVQRLEKLMSDMNRATRMADVLKGLPTELPTLIETDAAAAAGRRIRDIGYALEDAHDIKRILDELPEQPPELIDVRPAQMAIQNLEKLATNIDEAVKRGAEARENEQASAMKIAETLSDIGNLCPLCGSATDHKHILGETNEKEAA